MRRKAAVHDLKAWPPLFDPLLTGEKRFDLRRDDRGFRAGDILRIREWTKKGGYTGREANFKVTYLLAGWPWLAKDYVCMSLAPVKARKPAEGFVRVAENAADANRSPTKKCRVVEDLGFHQEFRCYAKRVKDGNRTRTVVRFTGAPEWFWWDEKVVPLGKGAF